MLKYHMLNSLTLDLPDTNLEDFCEHFERLIERRPSEVVHDLPLSNTGKFDDTALDDLSPEKQRILQVEGMTIVRIRRINQGTTTRSYSIIANQKVLFDLTTERFRRDRLRLVYEEALGPLRYAKSFLEWLTPRFGEPIYHVNLDLNPILREPPTEVGLTMMETWVAELTALGANIGRTAYEFGLSDSELERHRRNISIKVKKHLRINRDLNPEEVGEILRKLGYGIGTAS